MEREYVRGNKKHWKEVYKSVYGIEPVANSELLEKVIKQMKKIMFITKTKN
jgi:hypothetical protein